MLKNVVQQIQHAVVVMIENFIRQEFKQNNVQSDIWAKRITQKSPGDLCLLLSHVLGISLLMRCAGTVDDWLTTLMALFPLPRLVDDRCVVQPDTGDLNNPPKKFRGKTHIVCYSRTVVRRECVHFLQQ